MELLPIESSNILKAGYDPMTLKMLVQFRSGQVYEYDNVPQAVYNEFINSESKGVYLNRAIRNKYATKKTEIL